MPWRGPETPGEFPTLGYLVADYIEAGCAIPDGEHVGQPFILTDEQLRFLLWHYRLRLDAVVDPRKPSAAFAYRRSQLVRPQKWGKGPLGAAVICAEADGPVLFDGWDAAGDPVGRPWATPWIQATAVSEDQPLDLSTPVATPLGWSTVGELQVGDYVFDHEGSPTPVVRDMPVLLGEQCLAVSFSDGESVIASASHRWTLERKRKKGDRHELVTVTTAEMATDYLNTKGGKRYRVPSAIFELPDALLPIDPYLLGLWLGDGALADATIALDWTKRDEVDRIVSPLLLPYEAIVWRQQQGRSWGTFRIRKRDRWGDDRPSFRERLRSLGVLGDKHIPLSYLRAGTAQRLALLQGLIDSDGHVTAKGRVSFTNTNQALAEGTGELLTTLGFPWSQRFDGYAWRLFFRPDGRPVARLGYKAEAQQTGGRRSTSRWRYVTNVGPVPSVPVRCIGVATTKHLFLVGRRAVPTHNTDNVWRALVPMIELGSIRADMPDTGETRINLPGGGRIEPVTASARSRLGQRITFSLQDQTESWLKRNGGLALADNQRRGLAGMGGRSIETPNAWDPNEASVAQLTYESQLPDVHIDYPEPPKGSVGNKRDRRKVLKAVYGDSWWIDLDRIDAEIEELIKRGDPGQAERWFLNRILPGADAAFDPLEWKSRRADQPIAKGRLVTLGFDGARRKDSTGIVATDVETGHQVVVAVWERPAHADEDWEVPEAEVDDAMAGAFEFWNVWRLYGDPPWWESTMDKWAGRWEKRVVSWWTNRKKPMAMALRAFRTSIVVGELSHDGNEVYATHVANARRVNHPGMLDDDGSPLWTIAKDRPDSPNKIDLAVAGCLSWEARGDAIADGALDEKPKGSKVPVSL